MVVSAFGVVGVCCAVAAVTWFPVQPNTAGIVTLAVLLASYQVLLFAAFTYGSAARAQAIINTNFILVMVYDAWTGTERLDVITGCASVSIVACTIVLTWYRPV